MEDVKTTQTEEQKTATQSAESYEKRYNDSQTHITQIEKENATMRTDAEENKRVFDAVSPYIDWDAANGTQKTTETDDEGYVDRRTLNKEIKDLRSQINRNAVTQEFRGKHPDMVEHEDLVAMYLGKTDPRQTSETRIEKAVESAKKFLELERTKGREDYVIEEKAKKGKEAEASGLSEAKGPKGESKSESDEKPETDQDYVDFHRKWQDKLTTF